jgi:biopolymer transport protein TolR
MAQSGGSILVITHPWEDHVNSVPRLLPSVEPNITPMIDVLLVLLIVFMVMVVQVHQSMDVALPVPCNGVCAGGEPIVLEVRPGPTYWINRAPVSAADLLPRLRWIYAGRPEKLIQVAGHPGVRYDDIVAAMDVAKAAGVRVIGIAPKALSGTR